MTDVNAIIRRHGELESQRATFDSHWSEILKRVRPQRDIMHGAQPPQGQKVAHQVFDSTAELALGRFAASMESITTPGNERWHKLVPQYPLTEDKGTRTWLEAVTDQLFRVRYSTESSFPEQASEFYQDLGSIGTACMFVDDDRVKRAIRYRTIHMSQIYLAQNFQGKVDTVHRIEPMTARQLIQQFGADKVTDRVREADAKGSEATFRVLHCVYPRADVQRWRWDAKGMPWVSSYILVDEKHLLEEGGYHDFPYMIGRYVVTTGEVYGRSPAMSALPDIKAVNEMEKTIIRTGQRNADPPLLMSDESSLAPFQYRPGALIPGGVDINGRPTVMPLESGANLPITIEMSERRRRAINEHFLVTLFQILLEDRSQMTATEVLQRAQEKGALLAPAFKRLASEFLGPLITREIGIIARGDAFPPPPPSWLEMGPGAEYMVEYHNEVTRAQKSGEAVGVMQLMEWAGPVAQVKPEILDRIDYDEALKVLGEASNVPSKVLRSDEEVAALRGQRAQAEQAAQMLQAGESASKSAKNLAQAQALAGTPDAALLPGMGGM